MISIMLIKNKLDNTVTSFCLKLDREFKMMLQFQDIKRYYALRSTTFTQGSDIILWDCKTSLMRLPEILHNSIALPGVASIYKPGESRSICLLNSMDDI